MAFFDPDFNPRARPDAWLLAGQSVVGLCGILSLSAAALRAGQYVLTAVPGQLVRAGLLLLLAVPFGAVWIFLALIGAAS